MGDDALRRVSLPADFIQRCIATELKGKWYEFPIKVNWPELQLTDEQVLANAAARVYGYPEPYPDHSFFSIRVPAEAIMEVA